MTRLISLSPQKDSAPTDSVLTVSKDGYVRLLFEELHGIVLIHLLSGLDQDMPSHSADGAVTTTITGYTEWA